MLSYNFSQNSKKTIATANTEITLIDWNLFFTELYANSAPEVKARISASDFTFIVGQEPSLKKLLTFINEKTDARLLLNYFFTTVLFQKRNMMATVTLDDSLMSSEVDLIIKEIFLSVTRNQSFNFCHLELCVYAKKQKKKN